MNNFQAHKMRISDILIDNEDTWPNPSEKSWPFLCASPPLEKNKRRRKEISTKFINFFYVIKGTINLKLPLPGSILSAFFFYPSI